jgi:quercetin dioxygenase-like cupin family protein
MSSGIRATAQAGFVAPPDEGQAFRFLNTLTITKVTSGDSQGRLSIADHRVPPGFAPPPHIHHHSDEAFLVLDGEFAGFCGDQAWTAGPGGFDHFVAAAGEPAQQLRLPDPDRDRPAQGLAHGGGDRRGRGAAG